MTEVVQVAEVESLHSREEVVALLHPQEGLVEVLDLPALELLSSVVDGDTLYEEKSVVSLVTLQEQGPPGVRGPTGPAGGQTVERLAGETIPALVLVWEDADGRVWPLDYRDAGHIFCALGVAVTAADAGGRIDVQTLGVIDDDGWGWTPHSRIYLGANGALTEIPAADGFHVLVGTATSPERLLLSLQDPIEVATQ